MRKILLGCLFLLISSIVYGQVIQLHKKETGVFYVNCKINGIPLEFVFDTGANDVILSNIEFGFLIKQGYITNEDMIGSQYYMTATGQTDTAKTFIIRRLEIDGIVVENINASVINNNEAPLLLGLTALEKLGIFIVDFEKGIIKLKN